MRKLYDCFLRISPKYMVGYYILKIYKSTCILKTYDYYNHSSYTVNLAELNYNSFQEVQFKFIKSCDTEEDAKKTINSIKDLYVFQ